MKTKVNTTVRIAASLVFATAIAACSSENVLNSRSDGDSVSGGLVVKSGNDATVATIPTKPAPTLAPDDPGTTDARGLQLAKVPVSLRTSNELVESMATIFGLNYSETSNDLFSADFRQLRASLSGSNDASTFSGTVQHAVVRLAARACRQTLESAALTTRLMGTITVVDQPTATTEPPEAKLTQIATQLVTKIGGHDLLGTQPPANVVSGLVQMGKDLETNNERRIAVAMCTAYTASAFATMY
jgi:hypothetical protein